MKLGAILSMLFLWIALGAGSASSAQPSPGGEGLTPVDRSGVSVPVLITALISCVTFTAGIMRIAGKKDQRDDRQDERLRIIEADNRSLRKMIRRLAGDRWNEIDTGDGGEA